MRIEFETSGADFSEYDGDLQGETIRILKEIIKKVELGYSQAVIMDINGNKIGEWEL